MFKKYRFLIGFAFAFLLAGTAYAQEPGPEHSDSSWQVSYWNNTTLSGDPVVQTSDAHINWDWGSGAPRTGVNADRFSVRWTRYVDMPAGAYRCYAWVDDGIRVYVDGHPVIDEWYDHPVQVFAGDVSLQAGHHLIVVEYYENMGDAVARVSCGPSPGTDQGWRGEYFDNRWLSGAPALVRDDPSIDFYWYYGSPAPGIPSDGFSIRWTRTIHFESGSYRFTATTDDGVRLWVAGHLLIDRWRDQPFWSHSGTMYVAGDVPIEMEYYENGGVAAARLTWTRVDDSPPPVGAVIVDDTDPGFVTGGSRTGWHTAPEGYGGHLTWTRNNDRTRYNYNWARWHPDLTPGRYEVFVYIPERYSTTSNARYWVSHDDGFTLRRVDQSVNGDRWVPLGTYEFGGTRSDYVSLADVTYERYVSRLIAFDAVKWEPR